VLSGVRVEIPATGAHLPSMTETRDRGEEATTTESFAYKYRRLTTAPAVGVRARALGSAAPNGYTTAAQAGRIAEALEVGRGNTLLDLGAGRGWPGAHIATATGCVPFATDLPLDALRRAGEAFRALEPPRGSLIAADGTRLPFRDRSFDAACHTDVLC
jgi:SAM-dependent methyltransferase